MLASGDSGSWVVDFVTGELYGHVIAVDIFNENYVVPIHASLSDMERRLPASRVALPTESELDELKNEGASRALSPAAEKAESSFLWKRNFERQVLSQQCESVG